MEMIEKYKQAIDEADIAVWEWNIKENKFFVSTAWKKITRYDLDTFNDLFGLIEKIVIDEDKESAVNDLNFFIEGKVSCYKSEFRIVTKTKEIKWVLIKGNMVRNIKKEPISLLGLIIDITEEKESNNVLAENMYYDILTKLPNRDLFLMDIKNILDKTIQFNQQGGVRTFSWTAYAANPRLCLYSLGLIFPNDTLIRSLLYHMR